MTKHLFAICCVALLGLSACGGNETTEPTNPNATMEFNIETDEHFAGHSVLIWGERSVDADSIYPCSNEVVPTCFDFGDGGGIVGEPVFHDLCPSENLPAGDWTFGYTLFVGANCAEGMELNESENPNNFVCYAADDLYTRAHANMTVGEELTVGTNVNDVVCLTKWTWKDWNFDVCVDDTYPVDARVETLHLLCGCEVETATTCACGEGINPAGLPSNCTVRPEDGCDVICWGEFEKVAAVRFKSFGNTGDKEIYLGLGDVGSTPGRAQEDFGWVKPGSYMVEFVYDPAVPKLETVIKDGDGVVTHKTVTKTLADPLANMNSFELTVANRDAGTAVRFKNVVLDGASFGDFIGNGTSQTFSFWSPGLNDGFTFTGRLEIEGPFPTGSGNENGKVEILVGQNLPNPVP